MRGRAHRLQSSDPHDDWVDGSWTVDCVCGVNFDDGEEMVNCDECGVWVHTRCSKYVKGDELFACDKCKSKNNRNDTEETEVAKLLVELPTKTVRMEGSYTANVPARHPCRLWTDIPMEERVHVQGVPGGDPVLFAGLSSVFTPELWKCTGHVPKKLNFQYREFPCWDENTDSELRNKDGNGNQVDNGAGVLFSFSKDRVLTAPKSGLLGMGDGNEEAVYDAKVDSKHAKKWEGEEVDVVCCQNGVTNDGNLLQPVDVLSNKRKKEELGNSRDRSGKKKARPLCADKETDDKKRYPQSSKAVFRSTSDTKQLEVYEDRGQELFKNDMQSIKNKNSNCTGLRQTLSESNLALNNGGEKINNNSVTVEHSREALLSDGSGCNPSIGDQMKVDKADHQVPAGIKSSPKVIDASLLDKIGADSNPAKEEGDSTGVDRLDGNVGGSFRSAAKPPSDDVSNSIAGVKGKQIVEEFNAGLSGICTQPYVEVKMEMDSNDFTGVLSCQSLAPVNAKDPGITFDHMSETSKFNDAAVSSSPSSDHKLQGHDRTSEVASDCHVDKTDELSSNPYQLKRELEGSESSMVVQIGSFEPKHGSGLLVEPSKTNGTVVNTMGPSGQHKMVVGVGKSSSTSCTTVKSSGVDLSKPSDAQSSNPSSKERIISDSNTSSRKDHSSDLVREGDRHNVTRRPIKEHPKSSVSSKVLHQSRISHASVSKRTISDSKDSVPSSSSKAPSAQNTAVTSSPGDVAGSLQNQGASQVQNKASSLGFPQKGEKHCQSSLHSASKNPTLSMHPPGPPNSSAALSDEELALLLHQELNSSPRVPRVPRVRHTGSLPQLGSPTATGVLIKRTSSGGKDHHLVSRRKNKDTSKDGLRPSSERDDEAKKTSKVPSSPDLRRQDTGHTAAASVRREDNESLTVVNSIKKSILPASTTVTNNCPCSSNEANDHSLSSIRNLPRNMSDDDMGMIHAPVHRTLPGLINEIMSKGRRMTYEELCNAVLPHWPNLRKHNGERYAYSSHSQAVLDCLRNRHEWAQLVDRGPKTNSSRKRRKLDVEESEDNESGKGQMKEGEGRSLDAQREDFPKGKRNARKRRHLALQGRRVKDMGKRRKAETTDDDSDPFSDSSEDSMFSEDEVQGGGACPVASEVSASSDETGTR